MKVRLLCPMRGAARVEGEPRPVPSLPAGSVIDVSEDDAERMIRRRQAEAVKASKPKKAKKAKKADTPKEG